MTKRKISKFNWIKGLFKHVFSGIKNFVGVVGSWVRVCMENVIVVDRDEKDNTIAPLKLYLLVLRYSSCQSAVRKTVVNKGHNELELKNRDMFFTDVVQAVLKCLYTDMHSSLSWFSFVADAKYFVSNKLYYFGGNHCGHSMNLKWKFIIDAFR